PWAALALLGAWLGTSLFYYSSVFPFMAHAVGFSLAVATVSLADAVLAGRPRLLLPLGVALGALYLVRPQQLTIALPLALLLAPLRHRPLRAWLGWALAGLAAALGGAALQAWFYSQTMGVWTLNAYDVGHGGFDWLHPALGRALLNPSGGLLWVSPVV